ncbi:MAG: hypothetical protein IVW55_05665 [Chloroflexi bacterium]|nr:hypothetical protein [Chloroflexota bacterium]
MQLDPRQIVNGLLKRWWIPLLVLLTAAAVAYLYTKTQTPIYQSKVVMVAQPVPLDNGQIEAIKKTMPTYAQELGSPDFWRQVVDNNQIQDVDLGALPGQIKIQPNPDQNGIIMTVDNPRALTAATLADRISNAFVLNQNALSQSVAASGSTVVWTIAQPADVPSQPYQPRPLLTAAAAGLFGLILGLLLAIGLELLDTTLKSAAEVTQYVRLNTLGVIPRAVKKS